MQMANSPGIGMAVAPRNEDAVTSPTVHAAGTPFPDQCRSTGPDDLPGPRLPHTDKGTRDHRHTLPTPPLGPRRVLAWFDFPTDCSRLTFAAE